MPMDGMFTHCLFMLGEEEEKRKVVQEGQAVAEGPSRRTLAFIRRFAREYRPVVECECDICVHIAGGV
ncbi:MAG: hypothetical protein LBB27_02255 [Tannerellaceae bacterium]|nr:hypothetical protein [Tannerellaceae bacterium]